MPPGCYGFTMSHPRRLAFLTMVILLASCAKPFERRIATRLHEAGLPEAMSGCMAARWVDRLSVFQLREIQNLTDDLKRERRQGSLTATLLIDRVRSMNDPEILEVVSTSTARCAIGI